MYTISNIQKIHQFQLSTQETIEYTEFTWSFCDNFLLLNNFNSFG